MGNCTCVNSQAEGNAQTEVNVPVASKEKLQSDIDILNPPDPGQPIDSAVFTDAPVPKLPEVIIPADTNAPLEFSRPVSQEPVTETRPLSMSSLTIQDILRLQAAIRAYLLNKASKRTEGDMMQWSDDEETLQVSTEEAKGDPDANLSAPVKKAIEAKEKFVFEKDVKGVVSREPRLLPDGSIYIGQWLMSEGQLICQKGKGRRFGADGSYLEGYWKAGKLHYRGRIVAPNGDFYEGSVSRGRKEGVGTYEAFDGRMRYSGQWHLDQRHGSGIEVYSDGAKYEGDFKNNEKTGKGQITYEDGSVYKGEFVDGEFEGFGEYSWVDGRHYKGHWKKSKMNGKGKFTYKDEKWYDGDYVNDKKEGYGVYCWDNKKYEGSWKQGKMHGIGYLTNEKGRRKYEFTEGVRGSEIK